MIQITITDPTRDEALRLADYLFAVAGYGKKDGIVGHERVSEAVAHKFETTPAQVDTQLKTHIKSLARAVEAAGYTDKRTPVEQFIDSADTSGVVQTRIGDATAVPPPPVGVTGNNPTTVITDGIDTLDSAGHKWDERIHASSHAVVSDGTWRLRRNLDPKVLEAVLAERAANTLPDVSFFVPEGVKNMLPMAAVTRCMNAARVPAETGADAVELVHREDGVLTGTGAWPFPSDVPPPPPAAPVSVGVPPPPPATATAVTGPLTFAAFMQRVTAAIGAGTIAQTDVAAALAEYGVASIPMLASVHADKIDAVAARLGV